MFYCVCTSSQCLKSYMSLNNGEVVASFVTPRKISNVSKIMDHLRLTSG
jgi:hypothetical protein